MVVPRTRMNVVSPATASASSGADDTAEWVDDG
jgi:hypothetical protein